MTENYGQSAIENSPGGWGGGRWLETFPDIISSVKNLWGLTALGLLVVGVLAIALVPVAPEIKHPLLIPGLLFGIPLSVAVLLIIAFRYAAQETAAPKGGLDSRNGVSGRKNKGDSQSHMVADKDSPIGVLRARLDGRYEIDDEPFHRGERTQLFRGFDIDLQRNVAIKWLNAQEDPHQYHDFVRSCRTAMRIADLPNFLSVYEGWFTSPKECFVVMQYVEGRDLRKDIEGSEGGLNLSKVRRIVLNLGDSLVRAHAVTPTHGNLKPSSILLDGMGEPFLSPRTRLGEVHGSALREAIEKQALCEEDLTYLAPEDLDRPQRPELRDQYLLGLLAYDMLMGGLPPVLGDVPKAEQRKLLLKQGQGAFQLLPPVHTMRSDVPKRISDILSLMLAVDPQRRYTTLEEAIVQIRRAEQVAFLTARESYARCLESGADGFFKEFYRRFLEVEGVEKYFSKLGEKDWKRQRRALEGAVNACFDFVQLYPTSNDISEPNALTSIAHSHGSRGRNIDKSLYQPFVDVLIDTVCDADEKTGSGPFDPRCAGDEHRRVDVRNAWQSVMTPVVEYLITNR